MGLSDYKTAAAMRDTITKIAEDAVRRLRPDIRIGEVYRFNSASLVGFVRFPGHDETELVRVRFGADKVPGSSVEEPDGDPDVVRVMGKPGSYWIIDFVRGEPRQLRYHTSVVPVGGIIDYTGDLPPEEEYLQTDGRFLPINQYQRLFDIVGHRYNDGIDPGTGDFKLPELVSKDWYESLVSTIFPLATGWGLSFFTGIVQGNLMQVYIGVERSGALIAVQANGNIGNQTIGTFDVDYRPRIGNALASGNTGRTASFFLSTNGSVSLAALAPGADIAVGETLTFSGTVLLGTQSNARKCLIKT